jgi:hypothetical protein
VLAMTWSANNRYRSFCRIDRPYEDVDGSIEPEARAGHPVPKDRQADGEQRAGCEIELHERECCLGWLLVSPAKA